MENKIDLGLHAVVGLFDVNIKITMEITVRKYVLHCSICLHTDHGNQTILVHRYHNYSTRELSGWLNVTSTQPWLMLKNSPSK